MIYNYEVLIEHSMMVQAVTEFSTVVYIFCRLMKIAEIKIAKYLYPISALKLSKVHL